MLFHNTLCMIAHRTLLLAAASSLAVAGAAAAQTPPRSPEVQVQDVMQGASYRGRKVL